ncbi:M23 family metallopeptidase [Verrucomicrobia bacterium]|nr:M23 family metallopeptidase [Verrucomicrobiota bacterium]
MQRYLLLLYVAWISLESMAEPAFRIPTINEALWDDSTQGYQTFFAPTNIGKWESGRFGCVRSEGWKFHEGIDILYTQQDQKGEPKDLIFAAAEGIVCYVNHKPGLSNYGKYIILGHKIEGLEIYTIYAHLSRIEDQVTPGRMVEAGARIATMGRTTNSGSIARARAHLHFEITLVINENFDQWFQKRNPGNANDHGVWNGRNFLGLNPESIYKEQVRLQKNFSLRGFIRNQEALYTVFVNKADFPWLRRYVPLVKKDSGLSAEQITGYEITFNPFGVPYRLEPSKREPMKSNSIELLHVEEMVYSKYRCRGLVRKQGKEFKLSKSGLDLINLLIFAE